MRERYKSDLTDEQWRRIEGLVPALTGRGPATAKYERREIVNAMLYVLRTGCQWEYMPHDLPKWKSVSDYFYEWRDDGTWERMLTSLRADVRRKAGRAPEPTLGLLDSQSVKTTEVGGADRGFDAGKKVKGRKRHILVDIMRLLLVVMISSAAMQDRDSVPTVLAEAKSSFKTLRKVVVDTAYRGDVVDTAVAATGIPVEVVARPQAAKGWVLLPKRWVVERSFGWINRSRRLSKDYERSTDSGEAWIRLSFVQLMARRLA